LPLLALGDAFHLVIPIQPQPKNVTVQGVQIRSKAPLVESKMKQQN
jgi:hypothetical protein